jgi:hypothetical protein
VEGWFSQRERRAIHRGVFTSIKEHRDEIYRFMDSGQNHAGTTREELPSGAVIRG